MNVLFVSACKKRAATKTRTILDSYANRVGPTTWITPITEEALNDIWLQLKKSASKNTAVACYKNRGTQKMQLLWSVGSKTAFNKNGYYRTGTTQSKKHFPKGITTIISLASLAGYTHDLGKATKLFQHKLQGKLPAQDPVRHEWVSTQLLAKSQELHSLKSSLDELSWQLGAKDDWIPFDRKRGLTNLWDSLLFVVATHHRLFSQGEGISKTAESQMSALISPSSTFYSGLKKHQEEKTVFFLDPSAYYTVESALDESLVACIDKKIRRLLASTTEFSPQSIRGVSILSRAFLIMADHTVSARKVASKSRVYANTKVDQSGNRYLDQSLDYHLENVGELAQKYARYALHCHWDGLPKYVTDNLLAPSKSEARFDWQNRAVDALFAIREDSDAPALIMNIAGTGSGKTRMNVKAAAALNTQPELRLTTALGLRTLTLQTGDAYAKELGIPKDLLNCVIGDRTVKKIHDSNFTPGTKPNDDDNPDEQEFDVSSNCALPLPEWLREYGNITKNSQTLLAPPILVSTIDYLIAAGDPSRQGHHCLALMRVLSGTLILDEIDNYHPEAFVALLRLVEIAGMVGTSVITSSATLPFPMAKELEKAFYSGIRIQAELNGNKEVAFIGGVISNYLPPNIKRHTDLGDLYSTYVNHIRKSVENMPGGKRSAYIQPYEDNTESAISPTIGKAITKLHDSHAWQYNETSKISVGMVRLTYVKDVVKVAAELAKLMPHAYVATYHAKELTIVRTLKEKYLDTLLQRKNGNTHLIESQYTNKLVQNKNAPNIQFIVVVSPIEEVGRDHDFDWAVIEPNSARSIVQTVGRVNRHRLVEVTSPNIAILEKSLRCIHKNNCDNEAHYCKPGFEKNDDNTFESHSMLNLLDENSIKNLTAELRFGPSLLAQFEDQTIENTISTPIKHLTLEMTKKRSRWMGKAFYEAYPLRDKDDNQRLFMKDELGQFKEKIVNPAGKSEWIRSEVNFNKSPSPCNTWLTWSSKELKNACEQFNIDYEEGHIVRLSNISDEVTWSEAFGFK